MLSTACVQPSSINTRSGVKSCVYDTFGKQTKKKVQIRTERISDAINTGGSMALGAGRPSPTRLPPSNACMRDTSAVSESDTVNKGAMQKVDLGHPPTRGRKRLAKSG